MLLSDTLLVLLALNNLPRIASLLPFLSPTHPVYSPAIIIAGYMTYCFVSWLLSVFPSSHEGLGFIRAQLLFLISDKYLTEHVFNKYFFKHINARSYFYFFCSVQASN